MYKKSLLFATLLLCVAISSGWAQQIRMDSTYSIMKKVADWQWNSLETEGWKNHPKDWTSAAMYTGMFAWAQHANTPVYYDKLKQVGETNKWQIGKYRHFADDYCVGQLYTQLYEIFKDPKYIQDFKSLADTLVDIPHTESLEWQNRIYLREWAWCDALFMGPPGLGYLSEALNDPKYLNKSIQLWWKSTAYLYDKEEQLYYRDSRYFDKRELNGTKVFWSRGNGWVLAGLARLLSTTPENHPEYAKLKSLFIDMSAKIASIQQKDGSWHASLLDPESYPIKETSGTGFIGYALAWGINEGILPYQSYHKVIAKAWEAMRTSVHADGKLGYVQPQGAAPDKVTYDGTDVFGVGAFLLFGAEVLEMVAKHETNNSISIVYNPASETVNKEVVIEQRKNKGLSSNVVIRDLLTGETIPCTVKESERNLQYTFKANIAPGTKRYFEIKKK
ncbi:glycoside hydrolase family 88/105 protein [Sphingobacterium lumbrici]|uniref:glycoside hydrolase family 88/105 protein n=1 Tax=Sphingobacterium lumbrici TaxID=2559600 RepID=UPI00112C1754|nr:glycoside hydrolase family 88 protein [Sphingobacterium lumbrici]